MELSEKQESADDELFNRICERGKVLLNIMIKEKFQEMRQDRTRNIINDPLNFVFLKNPKVVDFENKQKYFRQELKMLKAQGRHGQAEIRVRRKDIFMDSFYRF